MRFVLIDEHTHDREQIVQVLQYLGSPVTCMEVIQSQEFDAALALADVPLVLTEYRLSWSDGLTLLSTIRAHWPAVPVLMVTHAANEAMALAGVQVGLSDYVLKEHLRRLPVAVQASLARARCLSALRRGCAKAALPYRKNTATLGVPML